MSLPRLGQTDRYRMFSIDSASSILDRASEPEQLGQALPIAGDSYAQTTMLRQFPTLPPLQLRGGPATASPVAERSPSLFELRIGPATPLLAPTMSMSNFPMFHGQQQQRPSELSGLMSVCPARSCSPSPLLGRPATGGDGSSPRRSGTNRRSYSGRPLTNRYNKSCDWLCSGDSTAGGPQAQLEDNFRRNPIAQVSSDILRAQGYTQQFKNLLSSGPRARRDSVPGSASAAALGNVSKQQQQKDGQQRGAFSQQQSLEERCNGDLLQPCLTPSGPNGGDALMPSTVGTRGSTATKSLEWNLALLEDGCGGGSPGATKRGPNDAQQQLLANNRQQILRRRQSGYGISITTESQAKMRCKLRKLYFLKRNKICDLSLALALIGLVFVVLDQELTALGIVTKNSPLSLLLRSACVASTLMLIGSLINYHRTEVNIALIDSGAEDWRVALTTDRVIKLLIEICVCAVCPFPGSGQIQWPYIAADERRMTQVSVPLDVLLAVPMFLRAYLLCRFMVLHSRQFQDAATRSIAALNRISMDFRFVIKTMMADHPMTVLVVFTCCYWVCMSWMFTQCERYNGRYASTEYYYMNSLWFIMVTFMSIGYGDVVPTSYCGRFLSITTGIVGAGVSSALIAVISRKLELSRAEKHVNNFMADSKLTNARKNAAASVLQHTWFIHKYQQRNGHKGDELRLRQHQRKFLNAINEFRRIKWDQRKLQEKGNSLLDVGKLHTEMHETLWEMHRTQDQFANMIEVLTQRIAELQQTVLAATGVQPQNMPNIQQLLTPLSANANPPANAAMHNGIGVGRKTSMSAQLRVPHDFGQSHPPARKYSAVHAPSQYHHVSTSPHPLSHMQSQQHHQNHHQQNRVVKQVVVDGFGPAAGASNLGLTNSCSSPCLQKSQSQSQQPQQSVVRTMRVLRDEDECTPLMMDGEEMA